MKKFIGKLIRWLILLSVVVVALVWMQYQSFNNTPLHIPAGGQVFRVAPGNTLRNVSERLAAENIIAEPKVFNFIARLQGQAHKIRTGEYQLEQGITAAGLLVLLVDGKSVEYQLTLPEGWTFQQIKQGLRDSAEISNTLLSLSDEQIMTKLGLEGIHPEGQFFPDTYAFPRGMSDADFLQRAYDKMQNVLATEWKNRSSNLPLSSAYEALILASIVEKETGAPEERAEIAGVFVRRLNKGMRLQTDPTVIYGMGDSYHGNIRRKDLRKDTPYNTYVHAGLTPTPISSPGQDAIHAVLHPAQGKTLYFVAKGNGRHQFSGTLKQHNAAVRKYQLGGK